MRIIKLIKIGNLFADKLLDILFNKDNNRIHMTSLYLSRY